MTQQSLNPLQRIQYNSPVILSFSLLAVAIHLMNAVLPGFSIHFFAMSGRMSFGNPLTYFKLISYALGHANWEHLVGNLSLILLLGPILEEKYGSRPILIMMIVTAFCSGLTTVIFFRSGGLGASGIVFMLILLSSIVNAKAGTIPLTFILVVIIFIGREILSSLRPDNISQLSHILGGAFGAFFGFMLIKFLKNTPEPDPNSLRK